MQYKVRLRVMLKSGVLDSQGETVRHALHTLGYSEVSKVAMGKLIELTLSAPDVKSADRQVREMAQKLLVNPVVEEYEFEISDGVPV
ncbi:MAG: phosphoribosylformylglycinamidine synthase subunit PurS [Candidatus Xenobia bacterium]